ncbi:hypothetical protein DFR67_12029 [Williamsia limnetica]|uniref:DUF4149 domain-containing protein n=2 Tax=Williamsia limnetica TaxID=882452 RepID=A0A318REX6_WILLI|nr:hypothetical protein DFR67_12029 [Williamsia limnetica]
MGSVTVMNFEQSLAIAIVFVWLGMVLAISFLETPLKFRAPGVDVPTGLGIGRLIFRALNTVEVVLALALVAVLVTDRPDATTAVTAGVTVAILALQVVLVRPRLTRRTNLVLAGDDVPHSYAHHAYIALEVAKVLGLLATGIVLLS